MKERLLSGEITSIAWLLTRNMWADLLTKESKLPEALEDVLIRNVMDIEDTTINEVKAHGQEVRMTNIQYRMKAGVSANCDPTVKIRLNKTRDGYGEVYNWLFSLKASMGNYTLIPENEQEHPREKLVF